MKLSKKWENKHVYRTQKGAFKAVRSGDLAVVTCQTKRQADSLIKHHDFGSFADAIREIEKPVEHQVLRDDLNSSPNKEEDNENKKQSQDSISSSTKKGKKVTKQKKEVTITDDSPES